MIAAAYERTPKYSVQELVSFSKVKNHKNESIRNQMSTALIISLRGHHDLATEMFQEALRRSAA